MIKNGNARKCTSFLDYNFQISSVFIILFLYSLHNVYFFTDSRSFSLETGKYVCNVILMLCIKRKIFLYYKYVQV